MTPVSSLPGAAGAPDATALDRERQRNEARGIIRRTHDFCASACSRSKDCPGMACRLYRAEHEAKDVLVRLDADERAEMLEDMPTDPRTGMPLL